VQVTKEIGTSRQSMSRPNRHHAQFDHVHTIDEGDCHLETMDIGPNKNTIGRVEHSLALQKYRKSNKSPAKALALYLDLKDIAERAAFARAVIERSQPWRLPTILLAYMHINAAIEVRCS
jgi:hypothetical protein